MNEGLHGRVNQHRGVLAAGAASTPCGCRQPEPLDCSLKRRRDLRLEPGSVLLRRWLQVFDLTVWNAAHHVVTAREVFRVLPVREFATEQSLSTLEANGLRKV